MDKQTIEKGINDKLWERYEQHEIPLSVGVTAEEHKLLRDSGLINSGAFQSYFGYMKVEVKA